MKLSERTDVKDEKILNAIIETVGELSLEHQKIILEVAKGMMFTRKSLTKQHETSFNNNKNR